MDKETMKRLAEIASKQKTTKADKEFVMSVCESEGVPFEGNKNCSSCYRDMAAKLWSMHKDDDKQAGSRKIMVVAGVYIWHGILISNTTVKSDEECERLLADGCPKRLFVFAQ